MAVARGGRRVVEAVSFRLAGGDAMILSGPNGAGKSTLLRALAGWLPLESGRLRLLWAGGESSQAESIHYVGHADGLKGGLTAGENLEVAAGLLGAGDPAAGDASVTPGVALARLGLAHLHDLPVAYLSAGQRRRVTLARLLVAPRLVWLLDEPATALDAMARDGLGRLLARHRAAGGIVVAATHAPLGLVDAQELRLVS